jgi:hypothetical protein
VGSRRRLRRRALRDVEPCPGADAALAWLFRDSALSFIGGMRERRSRRQPLREFNACPAGVMVAGGEGKVSRDRAHLAFCNDAAAAAGVAWPVAIDESAFCRLVIRSALAISR